MHRIDHATAAPGNLFTEGNPATATSATTVTDDWLNDVQGNICDVVEAAGLALVKGDYTQLRQAIQAMLIASQKAVVINNATFEASVSNGEAVRWDSGNSRFDEAIADGTANNRAVGVADVTNSKVYLYGECPLFSGLTPGARYYLDGSTAGAIAATAPTDAVMVGIAKSTTVLWVDIDTVPAQASVTGNSLNLIASATGSGSTVSLTAGEIAVKDAANNYLTLRNINLASLATGAASGAANSLDTGAWAYSTFYWVHVIYNPTTQTIAGLFSLSRTAPALPSGYTYFAPCSVIKTPGSTNYNPLRFVHRAGKYIWGTPMLVASALGLNATYQSFSVAGATPLAPTTVDVAFGNANTSPNIQVRFSSDGTNDMSPPYHLSSLGDGNAWAQQSTTVSCNASSNIYIRSQAASSGIANVWVVGFNF